MAKKENNRKNFSARSNWLKTKKIGRPKQKFVRLFAGAEQSQGMWIKVDNEGQQLDN